MRPSPLYLLLASFLCAGAGAQAVAAAPAPEVNAVAAAPAPEINTVAAAPAVAAGAIADAAAAQQGVQEEQLYLDALKALADGRPDEATGKLNLLLEKNSLHAGAWLDLAISHCELGNTTEALRLFAQVEDRFAPNEAIRGMIAAYRGSGCKGRQARRSLSFKVGHGYDSNVNQGSSARVITLGSGGNLSEWPLDADSLPKPDHYKVLSADLNQPLGSRGMLLIAQLRALRHDHVQHLDSESLLLGAERAARVLGWQGRLTAAVGAVRLDNALYQRQAQLLVRATPALVLPDYLNWSLAAGYSRAVYPTRRYYDATTLDLSTSVALRGKRASAQFSLGAMDDQGRAERPGGDRRGWYGAFNLIGLVGGGVLGELTLTHQRWRSDSPYSPGRIDATREQHTTQARASMQYPLGAHQALQLEWRRTWNRENIPLFQYDSHMLQLSWRSDNW